MRFEHNHRNDRTQREDNIPIAMGSQRLDHIRTLWTQKKVKQGGMSGPAVSMQSVRWKRAEQCMSVTRPEQF